MVGRGEYFNLIRNHIWNLVSEMIINETTLCFRFPFISIYLAGLVLLISQNSLICMEYTGDGFVCDTNTNGWKDLLV